MGYTFRVEGVSYIVSIADRENLEGERVACECEPLERERESSTAMYFTSTNVSRGSFVVRFFLYRLHACAFLWTCNLFTAVDQWQPLEMHWRGIIEK